MGLIQVNLEQAGYRVRTAFDGDTALELIAAEIPDILFLGVDLPKKDGYEVLHLLRRQEVTRDLLIIMLMKMEPEVMRGLWSRSYDAHLVKPFNPTELLSLVKRIFASLETE